MQELIALSYSPWSEKARWSLDHQAIAYREREYVPMFGELGLRWKTGNFVRRLTVPVFVGEDRVLTDSFEIARYANPPTARATLFPSPLFEDIRTWNAKGESALAAGRALMIERVAGDSQGRRESLPDLRPKWMMRFLARPLAAAGLWYFRHKYGLRGLDRLRQEKTLRLILTEASQTLVNRGGEYLLGSFTFADIALAVVLQFVKPVDGKFIRLGARSREIWGSPQLAEEFQNLVNWRDQLYERHRRRDRAEDQDTGA